MPYKDELTLLLDNKFDDYATEQKKMAGNYEKDNINLKKQIEQLQKENAELKK